MIKSSALAQPQMTSGGKFPHKTIFDKAAAYGFHICRNHPFVDGNKRVAFVLMDIFLQRNGYVLTAQEDEAYVIMMALADGRLTKLHLAAWLKEKYAGATVQKYIKASLPMARVRIFRRLSLGRKCRRVSWPAPWGRGV